MSGQEATMTPLVLHPDSKPGSITGVSAAITVVPGGCRAVFVASGAIGRIAVPAISQPERLDDLWRTTCFEIFWSHDGTSYREFNLSPSTRWACYDFDSFRAGMRNAPAEVAIIVSQSEAELRLEAVVQSDLPLPATVALNAIIKDADGVNRFWALDFATGAAEFHSPVCRALTLGATA
jgi:hypothetical protein